jgi:uncharacterized protein (DUF2132 family)
MGKTGTSSIQAFCRDHREQLRRAGMLYPRSPGRARHGRLGMFLKSDAELAIAPNWQRLGVSDPAQFRKAFRRRLRLEIEASGAGRVLLSDEEIFGMSDVGLQRLARFSRRLADRVRMVVYLRRQDDHLVSRYQQGVKIGWVVRLTEWAREDFSGLYDYEARLRKHEEMVKPDEIVVRRFDPATFIGGTLQLDFLDAVGIRGLSTEIEVAPYRNESLDAESVEFLRLLNLCRVQIEGATVGLIDNRTLVGRLARAAKGPVLSLPDAMLDDFMTQWDASNHRVARRYFDGGPLFQARTASRGSTPVQRLDPSRLDHFLEVSGVPARLHAPLRRLVEREAAATQ